MVRNEKPKNPWRLSNISLTGHESTQTNKLISSGANHISFFSLKGTLA